MSYQIIDSKGYRVEFLDELTYLYLNFPYIINLIFVTTDLASGMDMEDDSFVSFVLLYIYIFFFKFVLYISYTKKLYL